MKRLSLRRVRMPLTTNWKIFRAATVVGLLSLVVKLSSTGRELIVAGQFGRRDAVDAFLIAFLLPTFVVGLVGGSFSVALIPTFVQVREAQGREAAERLLSGVTFYSVVLLFAISVLLALLAPYYLPLLGSGFGPAKLVLTRRLLYVLLPYVLLSGLAVIWSAVLNADEHFALPSVLPVLEPVAAILFLILGARRWGIFALALGTVVGQAVESVVLAGVLVKKGMRLMPAWHSMDPGALEVIRQFLPLTGVAFLVSGNQIVDQSMAAVLAPGSVSALNYGSKLANVVSSVSSMALGTAALPYFSAAVARKDYESLSHSLDTYGIIMLWLGTVVTTFLCLFSRPLTALLFQRGAFTASDTAVVARVMALYSLGVTWYMIETLPARCVSSFGLNRVAARLALVAFFVNVALDLVFMRFMGVAGIALSTTVVRLVVVGGLLFILHWYKGIGVARRSLTHLVLVLVAVTGSLVVVEKYPDQPFVRWSAWSVVTLLAFWLLSRRFSYRRMFSSLLGDWRLRP